MPTSEAAVRQLMAARRMRAVGEVGHTREFAQAAYTMAIQDDDGETAWQARTALGRMYRWRGEHDLAFKEFREALTHAEGWGLCCRIADSHHDCYAARIEMGCADEAKEHVIMRAEHDASDKWRRRDPRLWAWVHDIYALRMDGTGPRAEVLRAAAISASWYTIRPTPGDWWSAYNSMFERCVIYSNLVYAVGVLVGEDRLPIHQLKRARNLFEMAVDELGTEEGYAECLWVVARGLRHGGMFRDAAEEIRRSRKVAERRDEGRLAERAGIEAERAALEGRPL
jgi:hypothetical protein